MVKIAPSVLSADFSRLGEQVAECERAGADLIHFDVMDGHFVPNISMGPMVLEAVRRSCSLRIDVHLMVRDAAQYLQAFSDAGADTLIIHVEGNCHLHRVLEQVRALGKRTGVALNPATPAVQVSEIIAEVDQILVMSVDPGFGGQKFLRSALGKLGAISRQIGGAETETAVDGGIDQIVAPQVVRLGANLLVAGQSVFGFSGGIEQGIAALRTAAQGAER